MSQNPDPKTWRERTEEEQDELEAREDRKVRLAVGRMVLENVVSTLTQLTALKEERSALRRQWLAETDAATKATLEAEIEAKGAQMDTLCKGADEYTKASRQSAGMLGIDMAPRGR